MMTTADADSGQIEHGGDVIGMNSIHQERGKSRPTRLLLRRGSENSQTVNHLKPMEQMHGEFSFPGGDVLKPDLLEIGECSAHPNGLADGGRSGLEFVGKVGPGAVIQINVLNHFPTAEKGRHRFQQGLPGPEESHACGTTELVGGAHKEISIQSRDRHWVMGKALTGIHKHQGTG